GSLDMHETVCAGRMMFIHARVGANFDAQGVQFRYAHQETTGEKFDDSASFDSMNCGGYALFKGAVFSGSVTFAYATFTRNLGMEGVQFGNAYDPDHATLIFNNMKVGNHAFFERAIFNGWTDFSDVEIGGKFQLNQAKFNSTNTLTSFLNLKTDSAEF